MSNNKKTTAVEWLLEKIKWWEKDHESWVEMPTRELLLYVGQAKEMEKQQMIESYYAGTVQFDNAAPIVNPKTPEQYYNETYNKP